MQAAIIGVEQDDEYDVGPGDVGSIYAGVGTHETRGTFQQRGRAMQSRAHNSHRLARRNLDMARVFVEALRPIDGQTAKHRPC